MSESPTQKSLRYLRGLGYRSWIVEKWVTNPKHPGGGQRIDLFNIIDIIAINQTLTVGVQSCGQDFSGHHNKLTDEKMLETIAWLDCEHRQLVLIGWRKLKNKLKDGGFGKGYHYEPRIREYFYSPGEGLTWKDGTP